MAAGRGHPRGMKMGWVPQSLTGATQALTLNHLQVRRPSCPNLDWAPFVSASYDGSNNSSTPTPRTLSGAHELHDVPLGIGEEQGTRIGPGMVLRSSRHAELLEAFLLTVVIGTCDRESEVM